MSSSTTPLGWISVDFFEKNLRENNYDNYSSIHAHGIGESKTLRFISEIFPDFESLKKEMSVYEAEMLFHAMDERVRVERFAQKHDFVPSWNTLIETAIENIKNARPPFPTLENCVYATMTDSAYSSKMMFSHLNRFFMAPFQMVESTFWREHDASFGEKNLSPEQIKNIFLLNKIFCVTMTNMRIAEHSIVLSKNAPRGLFIDSDVKSHKQTPFKIVYIKDIEMLKSISVGNISFECGMKHCEELHQYAIAQQQKLIQDGTLEEYIAQVGVAIKAEFGEEYQRCLEASGLSLAS